MAISGVGAAFQVGDGQSSESFSALAEVNSIGGPTMSAETIDTTALDTSGGYRTFIAGFKDGGEVTLGMNFALAGYNTLLTLFDAGTVNNFKIVMPDTGATTFEFAGVVVGLPLDIQPTDKVTVNVTIKISGQVVLST